MQEKEIKNRVAQAAGRLDMLSVMGMNRADRRRIAKSNGVARIVGSMKPFKKEKQSAL